MALTHSTAAKNAALDAIVGLIDAGTTDAQGDCVFMTGADAEVATLPLNNPAFAAASAGAAVMDNTPVPEDTSATGGTTSLFKFQNRDNTEIFRGTVATSGADINISSTVIGAGDTVQLTSFQLNAFN